MPILIDGHNLIGSGLFSDIQLSDEDDEAKLVARLKVWKSRYKGKFVVVFDRGITSGKDGQLGSAGVDVIFAATPQNADDLIRRRIRGRSRDLVLVTNDADLLREATAHGVESWRGAEFVRRYATPTVAAAGTPAEAGAEAHIHLSPEEVEEWLELFRKKP